MEDEPVWEVVKAVGPGLLWSAVKVGGFTGMLGLGLGGAAGLFRSSTPMLFAAASGVQCFTLGSSFWMARQIAIIHLARQQGSSIYGVTTRDRVVASTVAGAMSGAATATIFRGPRNIVPGMIMFSLFGCLGQNWFNMLDRQTEDSKSFTLGSKQPKLTTSRFNPMRKLTDEEYEKMLQEKLIRVEAEIALIDESIQKLKTTKHGD